MEIRGVRTRRLIAKVFQLESSPAQTFQIRILLHTLTAPMAGGAESAYSGRPVLAVQVALPARSVLALLARSVLALWDDQRRRWMVLMSHGCDDRRIPVARRLRR